MAEIFDLLARVSWDTNGTEIDKLNASLKQQDKTLEELRQKGRRLEDQLVKTNDPKKQAALTAELKKTAQAADSITAAQKKQGEMQKQLADRAKQLGDELRKANDPKQVQGLLRELHKVEKQIDAINTKSKTEGGALSGMGAKLGGLGGGIMSGVGLGAGMFGVEAIVGGIMSLGSEAIAEFEGAERAARLLQGTLKNLGEEQYFDALMREANQLAETFTYLDNDDIVDAQQKLLTYGKLTKQEISSLLPIIIDFAARTGKDIPSATELVIGALEGQGKQLKQYGINLKDAETFTERLALVQGTLGEKVKGAAQDFMQSSEGIKATAAQQRADVLEQYGEAASEIELFFKGAIANLYAFIKTMSSTAEAEAAKFNKKQLDEGVSRLESMSKKELEFEQSLQATREQNIKDSQARENKIREELRTKGRDGLSRKEFQEKEKQIQAEKEYQEKYRAEIYGVNLAWNSYEERQRKKKESEDKANAERNAADNQEAAEKAAEKAAAARKAAAEKEKAEREKDNQAYLAAQKQFEDEKAKATMSAMDYELLKLKEHFDAIRAAYKKVGKDVTAINALELTERAKIIEKSRQIDQKFLKQAEDARKQEEKAKKEKNKSEADALLERTKAAVNQRIADNKARAEKKQQDEEDARADREKLYNNLLDAANVANSLIAIEQQKTDRLIELQQQRVDAARDNSKVSLKIEEDRLNTLLEKRRKHEQAQRVIDAAIIVANNALTISNAVTGAVAGFKSGNIVLGLANVVAIAAAIAASVAAVKSATADTGFKEGGYTGDGDPSQESRTLGRKPYKYHKGEYVMDAELTAKNRDLFEGIHQRRLKVRQLDDGKYYIAPDVDKMAEDYQNAKYSTQDGQVLAELSAMRRLLAQREVNVQNNFDADGFGQAVATQMGHIHLKNLRRN